MKKAIITKKILGAGCCSLFLSLSANALELSGVVASDVEYTNNAGLKSTFKLDDIRQISSLTISLKEGRKHFQADANFSLESEHYYKKTFSDKTSLTTGFGLFNFDLIESFLTWKTSFSRVETLIDSADTETPDNRGYRNILTTGPTLLYQVSRSSRLKFTANYIKVENSDENSFDPEHVNGNVSYVFLLNRSTRFFAASKFEEVLDGDGDEEYKEIKLTGGFIRKYAHGEFKFTYGRTRLMPKQTEDVSSNVFNISLNREELFWHDVNLSYREEILNTAIGDLGDLSDLSDLSDIVDNNEGSGVENGNTTQNYVIRRKQSFLSIRRSFGRFSYAINGFWKKDDYPSFGTFEKSRGLEFRVEQQLSSSLSSGFDYSYELKDFVSRPEIGKDKISTYNIDTRYRITPDVSVNGFIRYAVQSNSRSQQREYEEATTGFGVTWNLF